MFAVTNTILMFIIQMRIIDSLQRNVIGVSPASASFGNYSALRMDILGLPSKMILLKSQSLSVS
jgi:hypothetical protein